MFKVRPVVLTAALFGLKAAAVSAGTCYKAYSSGASYVEGELVSAATTEQENETVDCNPATNDDCGSGGTKVVQKDVAVWHNYKCKSVFCSQDGFGDFDGTTNYWTLAWTKDNECDNTGAVAVPDAPALWFAGGCPPAFSESDEYGAGDVVSVANANGYTLVYKCKPDLPAPGKFCDMTAYEPGTSLYWDQAWTLEGACDGTLSPSSAVLAEAGEDLGGCPDEFDDGETYGAGDRVSINGIVYECKDGAYAASCSQDGFEPSNEDHPDAWKLAWEVMGTCAGTIEPTSSPSFVDLEDMGGCPDEWELREATNPYEEDEQVASNGIVFACKGWPLGLHCGQAGYEPNTDPATPGAWKDAWDVVGHCSGSIGPTSSPTFDELKPLIEGCPPEYSPSKDDYEAGEQIAVTVSAVPERKIVYECKEWPFVPWCHVAGYAPWTTYGHMAWTLKGGCTGILAPTPSPIPYAGTCLYDRCRVEEVEELCTVNSAKCPKSSCSCTGSGEDETCTNCKRTVQKEVCTPTQVENWEQHTAANDRYKTGDVVRIGAQRYKCVDSNDANCNSNTHQPTVDITDLWRHYGIWVLDGQCLASPTVAPTLSAATIEAILAEAAIEGDGEFEIAFAGSGLTIDSVQCDANGATLEEAICDQLCMEAIGNTGFDCTCTITDMELCGNDVGRKLQEKKKGSLATAGQRKLQTHGVLIIDFFLEITAHCDNSNRECDAGKIATITEVVVDMAEQNLAIALANKRGSFIAALQDTATQDPDVTDAFAEATTNETIDTSVDLDALVDAALAQLSATKTPTTSPTENPTESPTKSPTESPTKNPTESPTENPTASPTKSPTESPTKNPTESPTKNPTASPTKNPTEPPTQNPTESPTMSCPVVYPPALDFETFSPSDMFSAIPADYGGAGLTWDNIQTFYGPGLADHPYYAGGGFVTGFSGAYAAYTFDRGIITSATPFSVHGFVATAGFNVGLVLTVTSYDDVNGTLLRGTYQITLPHPETSGRTYIDLSVSGGDFCNIRRLDIATSGGTNTGLGGTGSHMVIDDIQILA